MSKNKLIARNTLFMALRTLVSLLVSFYTTRVVLHTLGVNDFGLFNVIYGVVAFFVFIVSSFNDSVQRFLSISMGRGDAQQVKDIVKSSFYIYFLGALIFCSFLILLKDYSVYHLLSLPVDSLSSGRVIYTISVCSIFITILQTPLNALVLSHEKMSFYAYMAIFDALSKLVMVYLLAFIQGEKVIVYSSLLLASTFIVFCIYSCYCFVNFKYSFFGGVLSRKVIKDISSFSFWNVFGNFAFVCRTQGINVLINIFFGVAINASYAVSVSVINATNSLVQSFISAIRPQIFKSYGEKNLERFSLLIITGSKYTFCFLFLLCCPVLLTTNYVLEQWLVNVPNYAILFVRAFLIVALIDSFSNCLISGIQATGKIKHYQLAVAFVVFLNLPLAYFLFKIGYSPVSLFFTMLIISVISFAMRLYFIRKTAGLSVILYVKSVIYPCVSMSTLSLFINYLISGFINLDNFIGLTLYFFVNGLITLILLYLIVISKNEKYILHSFVRRRFK